jgi:hypothetical protein
LSCKYFSERVPIRQKAAYGAIDSEIKVKLLKPYILLWIQEVALSGFQLWSCGILRTGSQLVTSIFLGGFDFSVTLPEGSTSV